MVILAGAASLVVVCYLWFLGHWFGRGMMFLALAVVALDAAAIAADGTPLTWILAVPAEIIAWSIASLPAWLRRPIAIDVGFAEPQTDLVLRR